MGTLYDCRTTEIGQLFLQRLMTNQTLGSGPVNIKVEQRRTGGDTLAKHDRYS